MAELICGVDEAGRGPIAGPVTAAAVVLPADFPTQILADSKALSAPRRVSAARVIRQRAVAWAVGWVWPEEIDRLNIHRAGLEAMRRAVQALALPPDHVLVDARTIPGIACTQTPIVGGDARDGSIAAASIVAKVARDAIMRQLDQAHPGWELGRHMGYPTPQHLAALRRLGPSPVHRLSFAPVARVATPSA